MGVVLAIAKTTYRESIRQRVLLVVLLLGLMLIAVSYGFSSLSTGEEFRFVVDFGLTGITLVGLGLAVILGGFMIPNEIERRVVFTILTKPVSRLQYLTGKLLGAAMVILVIDLLMGAGYVVAYCSKHPQGWAGFTWLLPTAVLFVYLQTVILLSVAMFLSTVATPVFTIIATGFFYIMGAVNASVTHLAQRHESEGMRWVFGALSAVVPNLSNFDLRPLLLAQESSLSLPHVGMVLLHTFLYSFLALGIAWLLFNEREF